MCIQVSGASYLTTYRTHREDHTGPASYPRSRLLRTCLSWPSEANREACQVYRHLCEVRYAMSSLSSTNGIDSPTSIFSTAPHLLHKLRRSPMNPFFAKRTVAAQAVSIQRLVDKLCARFTEFRASQQPLTLQLVFTALTADIISLYCFGESYDVLSRPNFDPEMYQVIASGGELALLLRQYPWVFTIFMALPRWIVVKLNSPAMYMMRRRAVSIAVLSPETSASTITKATKSSLWSTACAHNRYAQVMQLWVFSL